MKRQITFKLDDTNSFAPLTKEYFAGSGFKKISETENQITFEKGNALLNMVTFNPLNWKSKVDVILQNNIVVADFDINTFGQLTTPKEEKLWDTFVENYKVSVTDKLDLASENQKQLIETKQDSLKQVKWALLGALVFGVPCGVLAYFTGVDALAGMGAAFGAIFFMMYKINKEREKNAP
jgi:hypothetical protein